MVSLLVANVAFLASARCVLGDESTFTIKYVLTNPYFGLARAGHRLRGRDVLAAGIATHFVPSFRLMDLQRRTGLVMEFSDLVAHNKLLGQVMFEYCDLEHFNSRTVR